MTGFSSGGDSTGLGGVFAMFGAGRSVAGPCSDRPAFSVSLLEEAVIFGCCPAA